MSLSLKTDEELMELYQSGSEPAFSALYERYSPRIYGFLRKRLRDPEAANDLFQAVFIKFHKSRDQYDSGLPFAPWIFTITRTALLDWYKQKAREKNRLDQYAQGLADEAPADASEPVPVAVDLTGIPEQQKAAIELRYLKELPYEEIAKRLNTSPANVRQLVSRGVSRLKLAFSGGGKNDERP